MMTDQLYRSTQRFTRQEVTQELLDKPENSWMIPAESYLGLWVVRREGEDMIAGFISAEEFVNQYESEEDIATTVASRSAS